MLTCARCGAESPEGFRFCGSCGAPLVAPSPPREARKVVTALFCDMSGSTALGERLDPEVLRLAGSDDVANAVVAARVHAQLAIAEGDLVEAERWARRSIEIASSTDFLGQQADSKLQLARVLAASGRSDVAAAAAREALAIYESKGDRPGMDASRALREQLTDHGLTPTR